MSMGVDRTRRTIHAPRDDDGAHHPHDIQESPSDAEDKEESIARDVREISSANLVVHEMPSHPNGHQSHHEETGVDAAFALYSLAQPALSLPRYIDRLPSSLSQEDVAFLSAKGAFTIPPRHVLQVILCRYVEFVDPSLPLLDLHATVAAINDESGRSGTISILLLIAMIYAALPYVESKHVRGMGLQSKLEARTSYYRKVKVSYPCLKV
jgi:hypothetical protein